VDSALAVRKSQIDVLLSPISKNKKKIDFGVQETGLKPHRNIHNVKRTTNSLIGVENIGDDNISFDNFNTFNQTQPINSK